MSSPAKNVDHIVLLFLHTIKQHFVTVIILIYFKIL